MLTFWLSAEPGLPQKSVLLGYSLQTTFSVALTGHLSRCSKRSCTEEFLRSSDKHKYLVETRLAMLECWILGHCAARPGLRQLPSSVCSKFTASPWRQHSADPPNPGCITGNVVLSGRFAHLKRWQRWLHFPWEHVSFSLLSERKDGVARSTTEKAMLSWNVDEPVEV